MRILRIRSGFQADHSSSSYLFYAVDKPVSAAGQRVAHRYSSRAEADEQFARYIKWGESSLSGEAFPALLNEHYDVMASESYDSYTLLIAVPKTPPMQERLAPFHALDDGEFVRLDVHDYGKRLVIEIFCEFHYDGDLWDYEDDYLETLVEVLAEIRKEIVQGNTSFLQAVAEFYGVEPDSTEADQNPEVADAQTEPPADWTKDMLQQECVRRGITFRKSWTKDQLRQALAAVPAAAVSRSADPPARAGKPAKLSRAAQQVVHSLERQ